MKKWIIGLLVVVLAVSGWSVRQSLHEKDLEILPVLVERYKSEVEELRRTKESLAMAKARFDERYEKRLAMEKEHGKESVQARMAADREAEALEGVEIFRAGVFEKGETCVGFVARG